MVPLWLYLIYIFLGILAFFTFRLLLHLLIRLTSNQKDRPLKFRVDEDYDYIKDGKQNLRILIKIVMMEIKEALK